MGCAELEGILVDPETPDWFWSQPETMHGEDGQAWLGRSFILTTANPYFPKGIRFDVYCLETNSATRPAVWGMFATIEEALERAKDGPPWQTSAR